MKTVEVPEKLGEYIEEDRIETMDQLIEPWRKFLTDHHGDHGNGGEFTDFADMRGFKNEIVEALENGNEVKVETEAYNGPEFSEIPISEDPIEDSLQNGLDVYSDSNDQVEGYDVMNVEAAPEEIYATVSKDHSDLNIDLNINPLGDEMNCAATYFADGKTRIFNCSGNYGDAANQLEDDNPSKTQVMEASLEQTATVVAGYAEEKVVPENSSID
jgi:hypothetical protein